MTPRLAAASAGPSWRGGGGGSAVGASAAAEGAAVGGAAGAVRRAGAGAALLRPFPALLDVRRHPRPRRAAAGRAERLLRLQPRLHRHRRDADGRAAGAGAVLPARRREVAAGPAGTAVLRPPRCLHPSEPRTRGRAGGGGGGSLYAKHRLRLSPGPLSPDAVRSRIKPWQIPRCGLVSWGAVSKAPGSWFGRCCSSTEGHGLVTAGAASGSAGEFQPLLTFGSSIRKAEV